MNAKLMIEPSARVRDAVIAWPMVQPSAQMPPKPISMPPMMWLAVSSRRGYLPSEAVAWRARTR